MYSFILLVYNFFVFNEILFFIFLAFFSLFSADKDSFSLRSEKINSFEEFYKSHFNTFLSYADFIDVEKRLAFIFYYLEFRNISNLALEENNFIDRIPEKRLTEKEKDAIVRFFISTTDKLSAFDEYVAVDKKEDYMNNHLYVICKKFFIFDDAGLTNNPSQTFLIKPQEAMTNSLQQAIKKNIFSDAHSSPEYFGRGYQCHDSTFDVVDGRDLESLYNKVKNKMSEKVSVFAGDLDDRDTLDFLDPNLKKDSWGKQNYAERRNFHRYNFFKDFHSVVHATWQYDCLNKGKIELISRFQVFGNHETIDVNGKDKKGTFDYFVNLITHIRNNMLPTELIFLFNSQDIITVSHAFLSQHLTPETHEKKDINQYFSVAKLKENPVKQSGIPFAYGFQYYRNKEASLHPSLWSDYEPTENGLLLIVNEMDQKIKDYDYFYGKKAYSIDGKDCYVGYNEGRGFTVDGIFGEVIRYKRNMVLSNLENFFGVFCNHVGNYTHYSGHSHDIDVFKKCMLYGERSRYPNVTTFSTYEKDSKTINCWGFLRCSCHNTYGMSLSKSIDQVYRDDLDEIRNQGNDHEIKKYYFDCKNNLAVECFETAYFYRMLTKLFTDPETPALKEQRAYIPHSLMLKYFFTDYVTEKKKESDELNRKIEDKKEKHKRARSIKYFKENVSFFDLALSLSIPSAALQSYYLLQKRESVHAKKRKIGGAILCGALLYTAAFLYKKSSYPDSLKELMRESKDLENRCQKMQELKLHYDSFS